MTTLEPEVATQALHSASVPLTSSDGTPTQIGPYRLQMLLGSGGMGEVYRACDERLERPVALKRIRTDVSTHPNVRKRFRREARSAARLDHPGIVKMHDVIDDDSGQWLVMEYVAGQTLDRLLEQGPLKPQLALRFAIELASALCAAHAEGIVHRDLKARNILVTPEGRLKILDFGLAKQVLNRHQLSNSVTATGQIIGTPYAMSPEQAMGGKVDLRSDLFSLGSLCYEMATGRSPFRGNHTMDTIKRICTYQPPAARKHAPEIPRAFSDLIDRLLEKEVAYRPRSAAEVFNTLQQIADVPRQKSTPFAPTAKEETETLAATREPAHSTTERRQITVLCCELIAEPPPLNGSDPTAFHRAARAFEPLARQAVDHYEGYLAHTQGHRLVIYFGYPTAQEDAAYRATSCARKIQAGLDQNLESALKLKLRAGIHTGPAIATARQEGGNLVLGKTLDLTLELQKMAKPGEVLASDLIRRLVAKTHRVEAIPTTAPSTSQHSSVFRILYGHENAKPWQPPTTPLVARTREIDLLLGGLDKARDGKGQAILLTGEAGIGKSRLVYSLESRVEVGDVDWVFAHGSPFSQSSPLQPMIDLLRRHFELQQESNSGADQDALSNQGSSNSMLDVVSQLEAALGRLGLATQKVAPLLADLLGLSTDGRYPQLDITPQKRREMTQEALVALFLALTKNQPLILLIEDLHWMDPTTLDLIERLLDHSSNSSLLLLLTARPEFEAPWGTHKRLTQIHLGRLSSIETATLIERITHGKELPDEVRQEIISRTDGIPLFVEELTNHLIESGLLLEKDTHYELTGSIDSLVIPGTLKDSLMARLDRLGSAKETAQLAATIGREFSHHLLAVVSPLDESSLQTELQRLLLAELIYRKGFSSKRRYYFKHALIQDAAYESLIHQKRRDNHCRIAYALEENFPRISEQQPEIIAHHFTEAHLLEEGVRYWTQAGQRNFQASAIHEAREYLARGLEVTSELEALGIYTSADIDLNLTMAETLSNLEGMASKEAQAASLNAIASAERSQNKTKLFWANFGLCRSYLTQGHFHQALDQASKLREITVEDDPNTAIVARYQTGTVYYFMGKHVEAKYWLEKSLELNDPKRNNSLVGPYLGEDVGVTCHHFASVNRWLMGYVDRARELTSQGLALATRLDHTYSTTFMLTGYAMLNQMLRDVPAALEQARAAVALSKEQGSWWAIMAQIYADWSCALIEEDPLPYLNSLREAIAHFNAIGMVAQSTKFLVMLAEASLQRGFLEIAQNALEQAVDVIETHSEGHFEAEVYRLRGELKLRLPAKSSQERFERAKADFALALRTAQARSAKSLELRAAMSMSRLLKSEGLIREARRTLVPVYEWFTEGLDTRDLIEARDLIQELASEMT